MHYSTNRVPVHEKCSKRSRRFLLGTSEGIGMYIGGTFTYYSSGNRMHTTM